MKAMLPAQGQPMSRFLAWCLAVGAVAVAGALMGSTQGPPIKGARTPEPANALGRGTPGGKASTTAPGYNSDSEPAGGSPQAGSPAGVPLEESERRIGPLEVRGKNFTKHFTVVLHLKHFRDADEEVTVSRIEIRDETGITAYAKDIPYQVEGDHFADTTEVTARELQGSLGRGLLLSFDVEPSTPLGGGSDQVFGMFDGKLVPFSNPIVFEGTLALPEPPPEKVVKTSREPGFLGDVLNIKLWTGNVFLVVPVAIDWVKATVRPLYQCQKMTSRGMQPVCVYKAEGERTRPSDDADTFVRLFADYFEPDAAPQQVVVKKNSKVEVLQGAGILIWGEGREIIGMGIGQEVWIKVRIDGKEGWIHTEEDFIAAGMPTAG